MGRLSCGVSPRILIILFVAGCKPWSPPVNIISYGAPGRIGKGDLEIAGSASTVMEGDGAPIVAAGGWLGYGVSDTVAVEVGAGTLHAEMANVSAGTRLTYAPRRERRRFGALDGEVGLGVGGLPELSLGNYAGFGAGYHFGRVAPYVRLRLQSSFWTDSPQMSFYTAAHMGLQVKVTPMLDLFAAGGVVAISSRGSESWNRMLFGLVDAGIAVHFNVEDVVRRNRSRRRTASR